MGILIDLTGQRFERLVVISKAELTRSGYKWLCQCDCGNATSVLSMALKSGNTKSCGCLRLDVLRKRSTTHGQSGKEGRNPVYTRWAAMIKRCESPTSEAFHNYGGRGITVCDRWKDFANFYEDMGDSPGAEYSIDRISNDSGYSKENCRWATRKEQSRNTRRNRWITFNGETKCASAWGEEIGLSSSALIRRLKTGWSIERALTTENKNKAKTITKC